MDIILLRPVPGLGPPGAVVSVKPGRARHRLVPEGDAGYATPENFSRYSELVQHARKGAAEAAAEAEAAGADVLGAEIARARAALRRLATTTVRVTLPAAPPGGGGARRGAEGGVDDNAATSSAASSLAALQPCPGHAVGADRLAAEVLRQLDVDLPVDLIDLATPLTSFGSHRVPLQWLGPPGGGSGGEGWTGTGDGAATPAGGAGDTAAGRTRAALRVEIVAARTRARSKTARQRTT